MKLYTTLLFTAVLLLFNTNLITAAVVGSFVKNRPDKTLAITNNSPRFILDLDYDDAFKVDVTTFLSSDPAVKQFCWAYPSIIEAEQEWSTPYPSQASGMTSDNIIFHKDYYFILDSVTFQILATQNLQDKSSFVLIKSEVQNTVSNEDYEVPWLVVDEDQSILFILTSKTLISYPLVGFFKAIKDKTEPPTLKKLANNKTYQMLSSVYVHKKYLYVAADGYVSVFLIANDGSITVNAYIKKETISADNVNFVDLTFDSSGRYVFVLDDISGVQVFDITRIDALSWVHDANIPASKADFIQIVGQSLNVIASKVKNPSVTEYIISYKFDDTPIITYNRKIELSQSVKDVYADKNFLYLISGYINLALKHSIPGTYNTTGLSFLSTAWISFGSIAMIAQHEGDSSFAVILTKDYIERFRFVETSPELVCNMRKVPPNLYSFKLEAIQSTCDLKQINNNVDFNTVCIVKETINLIVGTDNSNIGDTSKSQYLVSGLVLGLGVLVLIVIILICAVKKNKNKYQLLEHQLRSNQGGTHGRGKSDHVLNLDTSLRNQDAQATAKIDPKKNQPEEETKEDVESKHGIGEKPLDVKGIYGDDGDPDTHNPF